MRIGVSFLKSKITRRFCVLFIVSAFIPTILLVSFSYNRVVNQLEEESFARLKREAGVYGLSMFDRMIRVDNELRTIARAIGRSPVASQAQNVIDTDESELQQLFHGIAEYESDGRFTNIYKSIKKETLQRILSNDQQRPSAKPFVITLTEPDTSSRLFFGVHGERPEGSPFIVVGEVNPSYLWGIGSNPLLPPMMELLVFDSRGEALVASHALPFDKYADIKRENLADDLLLFKYDYEGVTYYASYVRLFIESRFQSTGWVIILSQSCDDVMSALNSFKTTVPPVVLLFLLLILYLSLNFIRRGLDPLAELKAGTKRIAAKDFTIKVNIDSDDEFEELGDAFNSMAGKIEQQFRTLSVLSEIDRAILSSLDRRSIISTTLMRVKEFFHADLTMFVKCAAGFGEYAKVYMIQGEQQSDSVMHFMKLAEEERQQLFAGEECNFFRDGTLIPSFLHTFHGEIYGTFWSLPIVIDGKTERALILGWRETRTMRDDDLSQARQIANQLSVALTNSMLLDNLEKLAKGTIEALARTVDAKSKWTAGHSERVAEMSGRIASAMGFSEKFTETLIRGALLHDIGKIGISLVVLDKPDKLTEEEYNQIKTHPQIGAKILEPIAAYQDILPLVVQHHEKFDGTGYPLGLQQDEIDLRARILAVADVWDALVSDRPYREGWIQDRAGKLIAEKAGQDFDPEVVKAFLTVIAEEYSN